MDQSLSTVIIALITGVFSVITLLIQRKQDKVISKIDEQTVLIDREKELKQKLREKEKEREILIQNMIVLILETNIYTLQNSNSDVKISPDEVFEKSKELKKQIELIADEIEDITNEYSLVIDISSELQKEIESGKIKKSK